MHGTTVMVLLPKELPSLRHLSHSRFSDSRDRTQFPNCPVLEKVEILSHFGPYPSFWGTNLAQVTTLSFGNDIDWADYDTDILSLFPALQDLTLYTMWSGHAQLSPNPRQAPPFHHLQTLRVRGNLPPEFFTRLVAPALESLHIEANNYGSTSTGTLCGSFSSLCLHLYALLPQIVHHIEPQWATHLSGFVRGCTRIETLFVSKWMEEECMSFLDGSSVVLHVL